MSAEIVVSRKATAQGTNCKGPNPGQNTMQAAVPAEAQNPYPVEFLQMPNQTGRQDGPSAADGKDAEESSLGSSPRTGPWTEEERVHKVNPTRAGPSWNKSGVSHAEVSKGRAIEAYPRQGKDIAILIKDYDIKEDRVGQVAEEGGGEVAS